MVTTELKRSTNIVLLPIPGAGHLIPMVEMARRLVDHDDSFAITVLIFPPIPGLPCNVKSYVESFKFSSLNISFVNLSSALIPENAGNGSSTAPFISVFVENHKPQIKTALSQCNATALIIDFFATAAIDVADELNVSTYLYFASSAAMLAVLLYLPVLNEKHKFPIDYDDIEGETMTYKVPGLHPMPSKSLPLSLTTRNGKSFSWFLYHGRNFVRTNGIILNSFTELEPSTIAAIAAGKHKHSKSTHSIPPLYSVGPVLRCQDSKTSHPCIEWLDKQPKKSVVFLCFGSMGSFTSSQLKEIAISLNRSELRFLWAVRKHSSMAEDLDIQQVFPDGFLERTKNRGLVWPSSVPQVEILSHSSVGGFVTHCGWNSVLESVWCGVPMLAWPLYAEQHLNAFQIVKEIGVALELKMNCGFVCAEDLEIGLRCLMEGKNVRERSERLRDESMKAVAIDGSSYKNFERLVIDLAKCNELAIK